MDDCTIFASFAANDAIHAYNSTTIMEMQDSVQKKYDKKTALKERIFCVLGYVGRPQSLLEIRRSKKVMKGPRPSAQISVPMPMIQINRAMP